MKPEAFDGDNAALHDQHEDIPTNRSGNTPFSEVVTEYISRRDILRGGLAAAVTGFLVPQDLFAQSAPANKPARNGLVEFEPVTIAKYAEESVDGTVPVISSDYEYQVLIPWGTPIKPGVPEYTGDPSIRPTAAEQENQIGIGHDGMWLFPQDNGFGSFSNQDGMLCINHEFGRNTHLIGKEVPRDSG
ncbi:MAG: alkaline phosphatase PhoX [Pseudomonadota bacterium]